jgi:hypothetical protein
MVARLPMRSPIDAGCDVGTYLGSRRKTLCEARNAVGFARFFEGQ